MNYELRELMKEWWSTMTRIFSELRMASQFVPGSCKKLSDTYRAQAVHCDTRMLHILDSISHSRPHPLQECGLSVLPHVPPRFWASGHWRWTNTRHFPRVQSCINYIPISPVTLHQKGGHDRTLTRAQDRIHRDATWLNVVNIISRDSLESIRWESGIEPPGWYWPQTLPSRCLLHFESLWPLYHQ